MLVLILVIIFRLGGRFGMVGMSFILDIGLGIVWWGVLRWFVRDGVLEGVIFFVLNFLVFIFCFFMFFVGCFWVFFWVDIVNICFGKRR